MTKRQKAKTEGREESRLETAALSGVDLFRGLPQNRLAMLERNGVTREVPAGHVFFRPGQTRDVLFLLEKGRVQSFRESSRKRVLIAELKAPAVFGEMACIGQGMYHCAAETVTASRVRTISRKDVEAALDESPTLARRLLELVSERFVRVIRELDGAALRQLIPRMAALLLERAEGDFVRGVSHRELAERLGVYRESATAALGELRNAGIVAVGRKEIRILHRGRLERAARE